jgi:hypothetical protein
MLIDPAAATGLTRSAAPSFEPVAVSASHEFYILLSHKGWLHRRRF